MRAWSSTNVRYLLSQGRIKDADAILGHAHAVEGTVVHGEERGRTIGFPTANLSETSPDTCRWTACTPAGWSIWGRSPPTVAKKPGKAGRRRIAAV